MCLATCFKRNRKVVHSIHCPQFMMFADGTSLPPDWSFLSYDEKIRLKEAHMGRKRHFRTHGSPTDEASQQLHPDYEGQHFR
jgi:hypothetical protein